MEGYKNRFQEYLKRNSNFPSCFERTENCRLTDCIVIFLNIDVQKMFYCRQSNIIGVKGYGLFLGLNLKNQKSN